MLSPVPTCHSGSEVTQLGNKAGTSEQGWSSCLEPGCQEVSEWWSNWFLQVEGAGLQPGSCLACDSIRAFVLEIY